MLFILSDYGFGDMITSFLSFMHQKNMFYVKKCETIAVKSIEERILFYDNPLRPGIGFVY